MIKWISVYTYGQEIHTFLFVMAWESSFKDKVFEQENVYFLGPKRCLLITNFVTIVEMNGWFWKVTRSEKILKVINSGKQKIIILTPGTQISNTPLLSLRMFRERLWGDLSDSTWQYALPQHIMKKVWMKSSWLGSLQMEKNRIGKSSLTHMPSWAFKLSFRTPTTNASSPWTDQKTFPWNFVCWPLYGITFPKLETETTYNPFSRNSKMFLVVTSTSLLN